ncbi:hypothetical protein HZH66_014691 [Vespula vulgaris]|uniref:Uncharacterized protein n=1 Tax=Vespula vulgaris TaxID=7454 RepID=A0A834MN94_VESVU|nr:hypothetical protein HZH66_014691 [Vespula vulgaris]
MLSKIFERVMCKYVQNNRVYASYVSKKLTSNPNEYYGNETDFRDQCHPKYYFVASGRRNFISLKRADTEDKTQTKAVPIAMNCWLLNFYKDFMMATGVLLLMRGTLGLLTAAILKDIGPDAMLPHIGKSRAQNSRNH